jgi:DNA-binding Xre family transcriptional regulator
MVTCRLKQVAEARGFNRHQLSMQSGISYPTIDKYWSNEAIRYEGRVLDRLCEVLDCEPGDLIKRERRILFRI